MISLTIFDPSRPPEIIRADIESISDPHEFQIACALWATYFGFDELKPQPMPEKHPKILNYDRINPDTKKKMNLNPENYASFWHDPDVKTYFDKVNAVKNHNNSNLEWLKQMLILLHPYPERKAMVQARINQFTGKYSREPALADAGWQE